MFYYLNGRFPLTNGLWIVPDGEVPEGKEKINSKQLYEMFKDKFSCISFSSVSVGTWNIFWGW